MNKRIFLNYRREDSRAEAAAVAKALADEFGREAVFFDTTSMQAGAVWPDRIRQSLNDADIVVSAIGTDWLRAGTDEWGIRRIDDKSDWVRRELAEAILQNKTLIPVMVRNAKLPPANVLPEEISAITKRQKIDIRGEYWDHDIKLLLSQLQHSDESPVLDAMAWPYPKDVPIGPDPILDEKLDRILSTELIGWRKQESPLPEDGTKVRLELHKSYLFRSFTDAISFMAQVAPGCDIANHHPRWENLWKTVRVYLSTWDIGHRISDRDIQLARYFDQAYRDFPGKAGS